MKYIGRTNWQGRSILVGWEDGKLLGDQAATDQLRQLAAIHEGEIIGFPTTARTTSDHLSDPLSALYLMCELFGTDIYLVGDVPEVPKLEEADAIA